MSELATITPRFRRSVRIDTDYASATAIDGFHCPASFQAVVTFMAAHVADTEQGAFTWTGPYGGGKSSLAVALACLFGAPKAIREQAASLFGDSVVTRVEICPALFSIAMGRAAARDRAAIDCKSIGGDDGSSFIIKLLGNLDAD